MRLWAIIYIQAKWRARRAARIYRQLRKATIEIQMFRRNLVKYCRPAKALLAMLRKEQREKEAATSIQALWKGSIHFKKLMIKGTLYENNSVFFKDTIRSSVFCLLNRVCSRFWIKLTHRAETPMNLDEEGSGQRSELEDEEDEHLDEWLDKINDNEFDEEMSEYLAKEELVHYSDVKSRNPDAIRLVTPRVGNTLIHNREATLSRLSNKV